MKDSDSVCTWISKERRGLNLRDLQLLWKKRKKMKTFWAVLDWIIFKIEKNASVNSTCHFYWRGSNALRGGRVCSLFHSWWDSESNPCSVLFLLHHICLTSKSRKYNLKFDGWKINWKTIFFCVKKLTCSGHTAFWILNVLWCTIFFWLQGIAPQRQPEASKAA